ILASLMTVLAPTYLQYTRFAAMDHHSLEVLFLLERALNGIRMYPVPADVRRLMYKVKKAQGVNISRSFCGLNDHRN
ncbi:hypothetical protein EO238_35190, partial [Citrobacter sp. AAK_AS5]